MTLTRSPHGRSVALEGGGRLYVDEEGDGPAIVFVHGLPGLGRDFRPLTERLRDRFRCVTYDRTGYGLSAAPDPRQPADVASHAGDLLRLLDALALDDAHLAGWSYGGAIVMEAARQAPQRVRSLALLGSVGPSLQWPRGAANRLLFSTPLGGPVLRALLAFTPWALRAPLDRAYGERAPEDVYTAFVAGLRRPGTLDCWLREARCLRPTATVPEEVTPPCLVVHGARDVQVPVSVARDLARRLPRAELLLLDDAGHWPFATHATAVETALLRFLAAGAMPPR